MVQRSPNKRKSVEGATPENVSAKKLKADNAAKTPKAALETPAKTPKSGKKGKKMQNGMSPETPTNFTEKTPKSGKKGKKNAQAQETNTPKSAKKANMGDGDVEKSVEIPNIDVTPKSGKKQKQEKTNDTTPKLQKFEGTKKMNETTPEVVIPKEKLEGLSKSQRKRMIARLKKEAMMTEKKQNAGEETDVTKKAVTEILQGESAKKKNKKNKKKANILNKTLEKEDSKDSPATGKKKKGKGNKQTEQSEEDGSEYEVEAEIKPEKVTKTMNESKSFLDESDEESDEEDQEKSKEVSKKKQTRQDTKKGAEEKQSEFVLFVGNLPFKITKEDIIKHFADVCTIKEVRLPLRGQGLTKGFAFIELSNQEDYVKALSKHKTILINRKINVGYNLPKKSDSDKVKLLHKENIKLKTLLKKDGVAVGAKKGKKKQKKRAAKKTPDAE